MPADLYQHTTLELSERHIPNNVSTEPVEAIRAHTKKSGLSELASFIEEDSDSQSILTGIG